MRIPIALATLALVVEETTAQAIYMTTTGYSARPQCTAPAASPKYYYNTFSYSVSDTVRYATSIPAPTATTPIRYAPTYQEAVKHLQSEISTTTWGNWLPGETAITANDVSDPYGQAAWSSMWLNANLPNYTTTGIFSATVSPTPILTTDLVLPPRDYFGPTDCYNFPKDFIFGVAGSAGQIEGAIALEGRSPSSLEIPANPNQPNNYVTDENYFYYKQDIERLAAMGVEYYSFSIPWTRILPFALPGTPVNKQAIDHYNDLIDTVLAAGMQPVVTMLHFDTPALFVKSDGNRRVDFGYASSGYNSPKFVEAFVNYGKILLANFADRVPIWFTFNEPLNGAGNFHGVENVLQAHAHVYRFYREQLKGTGKMSIKLSDNFGVPKDPRNTSHVEAATRFNEMQLGLFANSIFLGKQYPESVLHTLPGAKPMSKADLAYISGTADFFAIDPYTATVISPVDGGIEACVANKSASNSLRPYCVRQETTNMYGWDIGYRSNSYVYITPTYFREYLSYLWNTFHSPIMVTEFGFPVFQEAEKNLVDQLFDTPRSVYYLSFMSEILKAIHEDGVRVIGALAWSFVDNWEFGGLDQFGIQVVNKTTQERHYKKSFFDLVDFVKTRMQ